MKSSINNLMGNMGSNKFEYIVLSICGILTIIVVALTIYLTCYYPVLVVYP